MLVHVFELCYEGVLQKEVNQDVCWALLTTVFEQMHEPHFLGWIVSSNLAEFVDLNGENYS